MEASVPQDESNGGLTFLQMRIDTSIVLDRIKEYLSGYRIVYVTDKDGSTIPRKDKYGESLANDVGIGALMAMVEFRVNPQTVSGNFDLDFYKKYLADTHRDLAWSVVQNSPAWGVKDENLRMIINTIMGMIIPFISRLVDNKERESYQTQIRVNGNDRGGGSGRSDAIPFKD